MIEEKASLKGPHRIMSGSRAQVELGCGRKPFENSYYLVDRAPMRDAEGNSLRNIVWNLDETPWAFAQDQSCAFIVCHQTLEHLHNLIPVMNEIWRIADPDSWVEVIVPHYKSAGAFRDPTHVRFFTEDTFAYWEPGMVDAFSDYGITGHFGTAIREWREDGNLYVLLRPLKTAAQLGTFDAVKRRDIPAWPVPPLLENRSYIYGFLA